MLVGSGKLIGSFMKGRKVMTPRPWAINGKTAAGWRIDSMAPQSGKLEFMMNPVAIAKEIADAEGGE